MALESTRSSSSDPFVVDIVGIKVLRRAEKVFMVRSPSGVTGACGARSRGRSPAGVVLGKLSGGGVSERPKEHASKACDG